MINNDITKWLVAVIVVIHMMTLLYLTYGVYDSLNSLVELNENFSENLNEVNVLSIEDNLTITLQNYGHKVTDIYAYGDKVTLEMERTRGSKQIQLSESLSELIKYYNVTLYSVRIVDDYETCFYDVHRDYIANNDWGHMMVRVYENGYCLE